jgi:hypothetical protein
MEMMSFVQLEPPMYECEQLKVANNCANFVCKELTACPSPNSRKMVMEKFLANPKIKVNAPNYVLPTRLAIAQKEVMEGMSKSLEEIKQTNSSAKLASKYVIVLATISARPTSSMENIAKVLGVHP